MHSIFSTPETMSPEMHMRLAEPFPPCAKSVRHFNGVTSIHGATREDFEEDLWMIVVPCMDEHLDGWHDVNWAAMESRCPWASQYKFANMLEFGDLITLPDAVLGHKFLSRMRRTMSCISRHFSRLECHYVMSSPRTWTGSRKQELQDYARHCSFLEHYPLHCPGLSPQAVSYCCVRLTVSRTDFARVLCVATCNKSRKLVDAVVLVSRNEVGEERGRFDDSEEEEEEDTRVSPHRLGDRGTLRIPGAARGATVVEQLSMSGGGRALGSEDRTVGVVSGGEGGEQQSTQKRRGGSEGEAPGAKKKQKTKTLQQSGGKRKGAEGHVGASSQKGPASAQKLTQSAPFQPRGVIDIDAAYFVEWKNGMRTKREFAINPSQVIDIGEWEAAYNQRSLDPVQIQAIIDTMTTAYSQTEKTYELPTLKLAPLGLVKPTPGVRADRLKPEDWKDELAGQYYYYAVAGQHNAATARALLDTDVAAQVEAWRRFCAKALHRTSYNHLWTLADDKTEQGIKKQNAALRSYFPLAMAGKSAWEAEMEFFDRWETGRLLAPEGAKWIAKKKKMQGLKPGVSHIENEKDGRKVVVYNVPIEGPQKKGKKEKEPGDWFVQVTDPDPHCWKSMEALTDNEKCQLLKKVINCEVVWVQTGSSALAKQGKLGMHEAVQLVKCDRILVRLWNYYQFKHENRPDSDWTTKYPFLKKREAILAKFEGQGLDAALWDGSRKLVSDSSLFKDYPPYMGCENDKSIKATKKLVQNKKLPIDWKNKVLSVLTDSSSKSMEVALAEGMVHILWNDSKDVTSIAPFDVDPLDAQMKVVELERAVGITRCHTCVLDLCEQVDIKQWTTKVFESLNALLEHLFPSHWIVVAFVPREHDYYFMTNLHHLSVVKAMAGKWVRRTQQKKSFSVGHNLYSLDDRMYILFKGDDLRENTSVVYDARLAAGDAVAAGAHQKVTPTEISEMPFDACEWPVVIHGRDPVVYKGHEWNPTQFAHLLEFLCKKGEGIMFLGKAHAQVVWEVLKGGRNVIALEGNSEWLQFTLDFLKTAVNSGAYHCEFITKSEKPRRVWDPSTDMWFKLSARKRSRIYEFLFLEKRPARGTDIEYMRLKEHMLALLDNYYGATRLNAKNFLDRLELLYFVESEPVLRLESYGALIDADEESFTGVVFDTGAPEEDSDTEEINIDYRLAPVLPSPASSLTSPSTNRPSQATPVRRTPSKLLARLTPRPAAPPPLRPGCQVPLQHPSRKDENIHFEGQDHTHSTEADWGHDMIWHPGTIQPANWKGEWVMAIVDTDGEWKPSERLAKSDYLDIARSAVVDKVTSENSNLQPADPAIIATADRLFRELHDKQWLELSDDFYDLETSPSKKKVNWKVPPLTGTQGSVGGGPPSPLGPEGGEAVATRKEVAEAVAIRHQGEARRHHRLPLAVRAGSRTAARRCRPLDKADLRSHREIAGAASSAFLATKSAGIRTSFVTFLSSEEAGTEEGATSVHRDDRSLGSALMRLQGAESCETDGGEEWMEVEGEEEGGGWEEGGEGDEGREKELITLRDGEDGEEGGLNITNEERVDAGDEDVCGETSDSFGLVYARPGEGDIDDDAMTMEMETQVVSGLSVDHEEYDAHHLATTVHPPDGRDEAIMTVSLAKTIRRLSVNEVIDSILGDVQAKTLSSTPSKDDALLSNETFATGDLALIQPCFPVPWSPLTGGRGGVVGGRQHVTSPKKCRVGTPALAVLALPAPTLPTKERKEKQAGKH
ncbi:hypothetical protein CBR_g37023 [Chara braunii]|uniref:Uncharacterized protein n=1 Tax=Chara braunii TaxID=69332 RepID=A0A388LM20_CHABU|nr:hypothetical protein CBR_g37023 [Chara braunii]|eukprot:GBG83311.1 hypothetical protein CBR_g37023 [Chara braunii]